MAQHSPGGSVTNYDVRIHSLAIRKDRSKPYSVRWKVGANSFRKAFLTRALAENFRSDLMQAARRGEAFDAESGLPESMRRSDEAVSWYRHACVYVDLKWPKAAAKTRASTADALATVTPVLVKDMATGCPSLEVLRRALIGWAFNPTHREDAKPPEITAALDWIEKNSLPLSRFNDPAERTRLTRLALNACAEKMDGGAAAATTVRRKRAVLYNAMGQAVEAGHVSTNPVSAVQWKAPKVAEEIDRRAVPSPAQVRELLVATSYIGRRVGVRFVALFALLYYAALRPAEALSLKVTDCHLPEKGWGRLLLEGSEPNAGKAWTDDGERTQQRSLKWRGQREVRPVPIPPELVTILREYIKDFGVGPDGRLFRTATGASYTPAAYSRAWGKARKLALPPQMEASSLARRPYDLRHGGVTLWLNSGVPAPEVARRAGHGVDVLLKIYAGCIEDEADTANQRIETALTR
jgi:integrase